MRKGLTRDTLRRWYHGSGCSFEFKNRKAGAVVTGFNNNKFILEVQSARGVPYTKAVDLDDPRIDFNVKCYGFNNHKGEALLIEKTPQIQYREGINPTSVGIVVMKGARLPFSSAVMNSLVVRDFCTPEEALKRVINNTSIFCAINPRWCVGPYIFPNKQIKPALYQFYTPVGLFDGKLLRAFSEKATPLKEEVEEMGVEFNGL